MLHRRWVAAAATGLIFSVLPSVPGRAAEPSTSHGYLELIGSMHEHSAYSDGWPGRAPATYYKSGRDNGLDFLAGSEHSDNADAPVTASDGCLPTTEGNEGPAACAQTDGNADGTPDVDAARKWDATLEQARAASDENFTGIRGFEWTSDRFGHINVYFSRNDANAKTDGGYAASMETFWKWFTTRPELGGGSDGLATFNHPNDKRLDEIDETLGTTETFNWNDFAYVPAADDRMVGIELYNDTQEYGSWYARALDKGWHVGAVGAEDLGHKKTDVWGAPDWAKTVILATGNSEAEIRSAMLARRFYAVGREHNDLRIDFTADGSVMGSRLVRPEGAEVALSASVNDPDASVEIITAGGKAIATDTESVTTGVYGTSSETYYFVRVIKDGKPVAYSSPVWIAPHARAPWGEWLAGDLHVHTCYSHDAFCPTEVYGPAFGYDPQPGTEPEDPAEFYTLSGTVEERFIEGRTRGLDYLAITDHNDVSSVTDPGFGSQDVIGVPGYENSISGHAQMLGATRIYDKSDAAAMAQELRFGADRGVFQANHPADPTDNTYAPMETCDDTDELHWRYAYDVPVETVEVWNIGHVLQPPVISGTSNEDALRYWECWLDRGVRVGATGGSDSHWLSTAAVQGPGNPTTWVFTRERSAAGVLQALREGRTTISATPPALGQLQLFLEADADGDGVFESMVGDAVPPGVSMRVRAEGLPGAALVRVRSNGETIVDHQPIRSGEVLEIPERTEPGWVHASLYGPDAYAERNEACEPAAEQLEEDLDDDLIPDDLTDDEPQQRATYCRNHIAVLAQTSAMYVAVPTTLTFEDITTQGEGVRLSARLVDDGGDPLAGKPVTFTVRDVSASATTNAQGVAQATLDVPDHGRSQPATASYAGELWYAPASAEAIVTWGKVPLP